jgi:3-phenylpropionate/trans-cinnamate dioxygenase ferredoxin reductase subunit
MVFEAKYVIVGGGIAGTAAAETLRKEDPKARIILVSEEPHTLYSRVLLTKPNFFLEKIPFDRIFLKEDKWYSDLKIELWRGRKAVRIDPNERLVHLDNWEQLKYEKLLLAVGSSPRPLPVPGANKKNVYYLRTIDDTKRIIEAVKHAKRGVAIGGGIIGFEMAEMMQLAGIDSTFVIARPLYRVGVLGEETARAVEARIGGSGVRILHEADTAEILGGESVTGVRFKDSSEIPCDFVVIGIGTILPGADMFREAGIEVNMGIKANEYLETNVRDIWTAGDCSEYYDSIIEDRLMLGNWANAQAQGQTAAKNMSGRKSKYRYVSFFTTHGFGMAMTYVGDVRQDVRGRKVIVRGEPGDPLHGRIVIEGKRVVGAIFFNSSKEVNAVCALIERKTDISRKKSALADLNIDLMTLVTTK